MLPAYSFFENLAPKEIDPKLKIPKT